MSSIELDVKFYSDDVVTEFQALRRIDEALFMACGRKMRAVARHETEGKLLEKRVVPGDLSDCRKLYFDVSDDVERPAWRLVFRFRPRDDHRVAVQIISIGPRRNLEAYDIAVKRLSR